VTFFRGCGLADIAFQDTGRGGHIVRVGSITKTFTAIAVLQLHKRGLIDVGAPANAYLRAFDLVPARASHRPVTAQHLLRHRCAGHVQRYRPAVTEHRQRGRSAAGCCTHRWSRGSSRTVK